MGALLLLPLTIEGTAAGRDSGTTGLQASVALAVLGAVLSRQGPRLETPRGAPTFPECGCPEAEEDNEVIRFPTRRKRSKK